MYYDVTLKKKPGWLADEMLECDHWEYSKQGMVVLYDNPKVDPSKVILQPKDEYEAKIFIPRENVLFIIPMNGEKPGEDDERS